MKTYFRPDGSYVGSFNSPDTEAQLIAQGCTAFPGDGYTAVDTVVNGVVVKGVPVAPAPSPVAQLAQLLATKNVITPSDANTFSQGAILGTPVVVKS